MTDELVSDTCFTDQNFAEIAPACSEFLQCEFINCNFNDFDLSSFYFSKCTFTNCDLSNCKTSKLRLEKVAFIDCKLLGWKFDHCDSFLLSMSFVRSNLSYSSFYQMDISNTIFSGCRLTEVDFTDVKAKGCNFENSDLAGAVFDQSNLSKADFRSAHHFIINPENNQIQGAKFSQNGLHGLLMHCDIVVE